MITHMYRISIFLGLIALLGGCASTVDITNYAPPLGKPTVEVNLVALDQYRNTDRIQLSLVSRASCEVKPVVARAAWVGSKGFFGKDSTYRAKSIFPANETINLDIFNTSSSAYITTHCSAARSIVLRPDKKYELRVNNWSTANSKLSGFGCNFEIIEIDANGKELAHAELSNINLPYCPNN